MLVLFETSCGYAVFKVLNEKKLCNPDNLYQEFRTAEEVNKFLQLKRFTKFKTIKDATESVSYAIRGKMSKHLSNILKEYFADEEDEVLAVADVELGYVISSELNISCVSNSVIIELQRCIRCHLDILLGELQAKELTDMAVGVAHGLLRYKLMSRPEKIDEPVVKKY